MKIKSKLRTSFLLCGLMILLPGILILCSLLLHVPKPMHLIVTAVIQLAVSSIALIILYRTLLLPVLRLNETVSSVLGSGDLDQNVPEDSSLLEHFQTLMDREYASRITSREAELDALQSQINPHFLYNTLECIRGQAVIEGADTISDMARSLSEFFRYSINRKEKLVLLPDEFRNVDAYIKIQNYRFSNKYFLRLHIDEEDRPIIERCQIPRLTLQPIIENALLHGVRNSEREIEYLDIFVELTESRLLLRITDYGVGIPQGKLDQINAELRDSKRSAAQTSPRSGNGIALSNINDRIHLLFGPLYGLRVSSTPGLGCTVEVVLPQQLAPDTNPVSPFPS